MRYPCIIGPKYKWRNLRGNSPHYLRRIKVLVQMSSLVPLECNVRYATWANERKRQDLLGDYELVGLVSMVGGGLVQSESVRYWPRVCKNASPKLQCARLR